MTTTTDVDPVQEGDEFRFTVTFINKLTGALADPLVVKMGYQLASATPVTWTYGGMGSPIVKDSTGVYHWDVDTTGLVGVGVTQNMVLLADGSGGVIASLDPIVVPIVGKPFAL